MRLQILNARLNTRMKGKTFSILEFSYSLAASRAENLRIVALLQ